MQPSEGYEQLESYLTLASSVLMFSLAMNYTLNPQWKAYAVLIKLNIKLSRRAIQWFSEPLPRPYRPGFTFPVDFRLCCSQQEHQASITC